MRLKAKVLLVAAIAIASQLVLEVQPVAAAGQQSCLTGDACISWSNAGSVFNGFSQSFSTNIPGTFNNTVPVKNNTGFGRNRDSAFFSVCFYNGISYGSYQAEARYSGVSWVPIGTSIESFRSITTACFA